MEVGLQNSGTASGLAAALGKVATLGLAPIVFGPVMNITASTLANWWRTHPPKMANNFTKTLRIGLTGDFFENGNPAYPDFDLGVLEAEPGIEYASFDRHCDEIDPDQLAGFHGVIVLSPRVTAHSLSRSEDLLAISRFGVGYGSVDVSACTEADVVLCITSGGIVNEDALFAALSEGRIGGAALDCLVEEPFTGPPRFAELDNVILAPHNIAWTSDLFRDIGRMACQNLIDLAHGRRPRGVVNPEVFERRSFQEKWEAVRLPVG